MERQNSGPWQAAERWLHFCRQNLKKWTFIPLGLLDTLRAYREGRATVQDYVASCSARIAELEPRIQAWEWFDPSRAMAEAEERAGGILADLPLFGIPVGVKDIINTRGIPDAHGLAHLREQRARAIRRGWCAASKRSAAS